VFAAARLLQVRFGALQGLAEAFAVKWLEQIIYCVHFKRAHGVLIVGRDKNN